MAGVARWLGMTAAYALRGRHGALLAGSKPVLAPCLQVVAGGDRWLLMAFRDISGTRGDEFVVSRPSVVLVRRPSPPSD